MWPVNSPDVPDWLEVVTESPPPDPPEFEEDPAKDPTEEKPAPDAPAPNREGLAARPAHWHGRYTG